MAKPSSNPTPGNDADLEHHKLAREAVLALHNALAAHRQHPDAPKVWRPARRRAIEHLLATTLEAPLSLGLRAGSVYVANEAVLTFHPDEPPFGLLRRAGIGELELQPSLGAEELEALLQQLSAMAGSGDADGELTALIDAARIPGVELHAAVDLPAADQDRGPDWNALPAPHPSTPGVRAMIDRDCNSNLPALAARQLFDDLETETTSSTTLQPTTAPSAHILSRLMQRVLDKDDIGTTTWLLTELEHRPQFDAETRAQMLAMAREHCSVTWLQTKLDGGTTDDLLQVSALAMQLGDEVAEKFAHAAAAIAHPLSRWLGELLGHPGIDAPRPAPGS